MWVRALVTLWAAERVRESSSGCQMLLLHRLSHTAARHSVAAAASMGKVYAVKLGRQPGLYQTWDDARKQVGPS